MNIIEKIKLQTRSLLHSMFSNNTPITAKLKFYEILFKMQLNKTPQSKREIFYQSVSIFKSQGRVNNLIAQTVNEFGVTEADLFISASLKGLIYLPQKTIHFRYAMHDICIKKHGLIPNMYKIKRIEVTIKYVLIIEKDSMFSNLISLIDKLIEEGKNILQLNECMLVCTKGYPDLNTLRFLSTLNANNVFGLFDFDPFGIHIFLVIKNGSKKNNNLRIEKIKKIGINMEDIFIYKIDEKETLELNKWDNKKIKTMLDDKTIDKDIKNDLLFIKGYGRKLEMDIFILRDPLFMVNYLNSKLENENIK
ncbi:putative meiosis-specific protein SPO11 like protein [Astathelohania contejeani]|uniref:DNA topoisomerase (ATP-hydrolyzing) n=1 Tax=Astathelohania contejeani TaxID=164912 RepID=A0ABQ7I1L0_9MICR|nr:putative meiosis-specific protein SPO11 like protein [Thelohania contejeani]